MDEIQFLKFEDWQEELSRNRLIDSWIKVFDLHKEKKEITAHFVVLFPIQKILYKKSSGILIGM